MTSLHPCPSRSFAKACDCRAERIIHILTLGAGRWSMAESWKAGNTERWKGENVASENVERWKGRKVEGRWKVGKVVSINVKGSKVERSKVENGKVKRWKGDNYKV